MVRDDVIAQVANQFAFQIEVWILVLASRVHDKLEAAGHLRRDLHEHIFERSPGFGNVEAPALKFDGVRRDKRRRSGVLRFGHEDFKKAGATGGRHTEIEFANRTVGRFVQVAGDGFQPHQPGGCEDFRPVEHRIALGVFPAGFRRGAVERVANRFEMRPAIDQRAAEPGLIIRVELGLFAQRGGRTARLQDQDFLNGFSVTRRDQQRIGLSDRDFNLRSRFLVLGLFLGLVLFVCLGIGERFLQRPGEVFAGNHQRGEFHVADFFRFECLAGVHPFLLQNGQVGFQLAAFFLRIDEQQPGGQWSWVALPAVLKDGERELALSQTAVVGESDAELPLQRRNEFLSDLVHQLLGKRLHSRVAPELAAGVRLVGRPGLCIVRYSNNPQGVCGQQFLRRRNGRLVGA